MGEESIADRGGLSRRELLKRMAAGSAIAWTAPVVSSFNTPAFAGFVSPVGDCTPCRVGDFGSYVCGATSGPFAECTCQAVIGGLPGECFCHEVIACNDPRVVPCASDADCTEPGWRCTSNACFPDGGCVPPCGTNAAPGVALDRTGATSAG